jgi:hypothetical protein
MDGESHESAFHLSFAYLIAKIPEHKICAVKVERR